MTLTIGILTYTINDEYRDMTQKCIDSFKNYADELIVVENGGKYNWEADIFVKYIENVGYTKGVNTILELATSDYILFISNDVTLTYGNLKDLCLPNTVTSPNIFPHHESGFSGAIFCVPRTVLDKVGYLDERMVLRYSDTEYAERLLKNHIPIKQVSGISTEHLVDQTIHLTFDMAKNDAEVYKNVR
jgi:GT2 family glycosyltransferase